MCEAIRLYCGLGCGLIGAVTGTNSGVPRHLILKSRGWAHVEGDLRCPSPPDSRRERNTGSVSELHFGWFSVHMVLFKFVL